MELLRNKKKLVLTTIIFWIIFYGINNYIWLKKSVDFPFEYNESDAYSAMTFFWYERFNNFQIGPIRHALKTGVVYEPLYFVPAIICSNIFGRSYRLHIMLNLIYFGLLLCSTYFLTKVLYDTNSAIISVCLLSFYPSIYGLSRKFFIEFGMTWLVVLAILMLIKTQFFSIRRNSIFFGLLLGLGMMTKGTFFLFIFGPLSYSVFRIFKQSNKNTVVILKDNFLNLAIALAIALLVCGDRYLNFNVLYHHSTQFICESSGLRPLFYIKDLIHKQISFPFFVIFVVSLIYLFIKKKKENETILLLYFFIPFLYLSLMLHRKETRYMLPLLPAVAIISASFLNSIARRKLRMDMIFLLFSIGLLQFYDFSFGIGFNFDKLGIRQNNQEDYSKIHRPISQDKNYYKRLLEIFLLHVDYPEKAKVLALPDERRVLRVQEWNNLKWLRMVPFDLELISIDSSTVKTISNSIPRADFIIYIGRQDLKNKSVFQSYIKMMFEQQIDHIKTHPFIVTPSVYRQLLKGNCAILYPQNYLDLTKLSNDFLNFKLIAKYQLDAEQYIYIYKCIEKKLNEN